MKKKLVFISKQFQIGELADVSKIEDGVINESYLITDNSGSKYVLQKLHEIFSYKLLNDFDVITGHLSKNGLLTTKLVFTKNGNPGFIEERNIWRMLTFIPGTTLSAGLTPRLAESAGRLVAVFHNALSKLSYKFEHVVEGFHNTEEIIAGLDEINSSRYRDSKNKELVDLGTKVVREYGTLKNSINDLPERIIHGDLKLSNIRFDEPGKKAVSILDLDTVSKNKIFYDIGDVVRSWCRGSDNKLDTKLFESMIEGYFSKANFLTTQEKLSLYSGTGILILELCARYIIDAYEESYFRLDASKYDSLYDQNSSKAFGLFTFYIDFKSKKRFIEDIINKYI